MIAQCTKLKCPKTGRGPEYLRRLDHAGMRMFGLKWNTLENEHTFAAVRRTSSSVFVHRPRCSHQPSAEKKSDLHSRPINMYNTALALVWQRETCYVTRNHECNTVQYETTEERFTNKVVLVPVINAILSEDDATNVRSTRCITCAVICCWKVQVED